MIDFSLSLVENRLKLCYVIMCTRGIEMVVWLYIKLDILICVRLMILYDVWIFVGWLVKYWNFV